MTRPEIETAMQQQKKAYALLLWIIRQSEEHQELLSDQQLEVYRYGQTCAAWLEKLLGSLPDRIRPEKFDATPVAYLFSSFFTTSFRVLDYKLDSRPRRMLVAGTPATDSGVRRSKKAKSRSKETLAELRRIALRGLADELEIAATDAELDSVAGSTKNGGDVNLWSYGFEVVRRSRFASQGPAVHEMWKSIPEDERKWLDVDTIWEARERLARAILEATVVSKTND